VAFFGKSQDNCSNYEYEEDTRYLVAARVANNSASDGLRSGARILFAVKL